MRLLRIVRGEKSNLLYIYIYIYIYTNKASMKQYDQYVFRLMLKDKSDLYKIITAKKFNWISFYFLRIALIKKGMSQSFAVCSGLDT